MARTVAYAFAAALVLSSCHGGDDYSSYSEHDLHERAQKLPLKERYELYLQVYRSRIPRNPILSEDVVALGSPARKMIFAKTGEADINEFGAQLSIIDAFGERCSKSEMQLLNDAIRRLAGEGSTREALLIRAAVDCRWRSVVKPVTSASDAATAR